jgi:RNA polymerase sigma factor (sigma-70 family)
MNNKPNVTIVLVDPNDEALVLAARRGDEHAFATLVNRYQQKMFAIVLRYARVREDAEDIVQQAFQKAFIHLHKFEGKSSFSTWLTRIAINEALMFLRRGRALREVPIDDSSDKETAIHDVEIPDLVPGPEAVYLKQEETRALTEAIDKLRAGQRTAIELRELGELSTKETARQLGVSVAATKARIFHGRNKLRKALRRLGIAPQGARSLSIARLANRSCSSVR